MVPRSAPSWPAGANSRRVHPGGRLRCGRVGRHREGGARSARRGRSTFTAALGNGAFARRIRSDLGSPNDSGRILVGDVLGQDGRLELIKLRSLTGLVTVHRLQANGVFDSGVSTNLGAVVDTGRLLVIDCNGDRRDDLRANQRNLAGCRLPCPDRRHLRRRHRDRPSERLQRPGSYSNRRFQRRRPDGPAEAGIAVRARLCPLLPGQRRFWRRALKPTSARPRGFAIDAGLHPGRRCRQGRQPGHLAPLLELHAVDCYRSKADGTFDRPVTTAPGAGTFLKATSRPPISTAAAAPT